MRLALKHKIMPKNVLRVMRYDVCLKRLVARPLTTWDRDNRHLPGILQKKLHTSMFPVYDNMELIMHSAFIGKHLHALQQQDEREEMPSKHHSKYKNKKR